MKSLQLTKPHMLVVVGLPGSGKTYFSSRFSDTFNAPYIDYGQYRRGAGDFKIGSKLAAHSLAQVLKTKSTVVVEGRGATFADRKDLVKAANKYGYDVLFVWVQTEPSTSQQRATRSKTAPLTKEDFVKQASEFENMKKDEKYVVVSGKHTYASQARVVLKKLIVPRAETPAPAAPSRPAPRRNPIVR